MTGRLAGKVALITGAGSRPGLGSATAMRFAREGCLLMLTDVDLSSVSAVAVEIGRTATAMQHDVTKPEAWDSVFADIASRHGRLDILINNAGIAILKPIEAITDADWIRQNDVNLNSVFYGTQRAVAMMRKTGSGGSIVNISSIGGMVGVIGCAAYSAAKGGVRIFTKTVALETARDAIRVNSVHPGMIRTQMQDVALRDNPEQYDIISAAIPMGYMGAPEDVANLNLFLASDEARYVTGAEFVVDGGLTAQ